MENQVHNQQINQGFNVIDKSDKKKSSRTIVIAIFIVGLLVVSLFFVYLKFFSKNFTRDTKTSTEDLTPTATGYTGSMTASLQDVSGGPSSGIITRLRTSTDVTYNVVANLPDPEEGLFYQLWISNSDGTYMRAIGKLEKSRGYRLTNTYKFEKPPVAKLIELSNVVLVTKESADDDKPETTILRGSFLD